MIMLMGILRRSLVVLVMTVTALASALDGCLVDCHPQAPAAVTEAHVHCHPPALSAVEGPALSSVEGPPAQQTGAHWQADPTCHHDHTAAAAESAVRIRIDSQRLGVVVSPLTLCVRPPVSISLVARRSPTDRSGPALAIVPLRV